jgi:hypothetical protein
MSTELHTSTVPIQHTRIYLQTGTKIGFTFTRLLKRWDYKKNEKELLLTLFFEVKLFMGGF